MLMKIQRSKKQLKPVDLNLKQRYNITIKKANLLVLN